MATAVATRRPANRGRRTPEPRAIRRRRALVAWGFTLPFMVLFLVFMAGPVLGSFLMSFTDLRSSDLRTPLAVEPVGLDNYARLLSDELFH